MCSSTLTSECRGVLLAQCLQCIGGVCQTCSLAFAGKYAEDHCDDPCSRVMRQVAATHHLCLDKQQQQLRSDRARNM